MSRREPSPMRELVGALLELGAARVAGVLLLLLSVGATEGIGIMLLVPLLSVVGIDVSHGGTSGIARMVARVLGGVGIPVTLGWILVVYVVLVTLRSLLAQLQMHAHSSLQVDAVYHIRGQLYRAITRARWPFLSRARTADFSHALITEASRAGSAVVALMLLLSNAVVAVVYIAIAFQASFRLSLVAFATGGVLSIALRRLTRSARTSGEAISDTGREMHATIAEHVAGLKVAKAYAAEARHAEQFDQVGDSAIRAWKSMSASFAVLRFAQEVGGVLIVAAILYLALRVLQVPVAPVLLLMFLVTRMVPRLSTVQMMQHDLLSSLPSFVSLRRVQRECEQAAEPNADAAPPLPLEREIRLDHVTYHYGDERAAPALREVDLRIPAHRITAIVGSSGAGKSTVADLLMGLLVPDQGSVRVDDATLDGAALRGWRARVGFVPQESFLFHDSIRANLAWAAPTADEAQMRDALRLAAADEFVARLPRGLDTVVGERGAQLSGGERQRLALARALLRRPSVLILDEATSALDADGELRIADAITSLRGTVTTVLITHRLGLAARADLVHVLEAGRVVESGDWATLVARPGGRLRALCEAQGVRLPAIEA
jgi:ATP-binding cassette subfamily C protein